MKELARLTSAEILLVHVADGWAARNFDQLNLRESEEMREDRAYLERVRAECDKLVSGASSTSQLCGADDMCVFVYVFRGHMRLVHQPLHAQVA